MSSTITAADVATCYIPILSGSLIQIDSVDPGVLPKPQYTCASGVLVCKITTKSQRWFSATFQGKLPEIGYLLANMGVLPSGKQT